MSERKSLEHDTAPETPQSRRTVAVRTGRSDPPPSLYPTPRPAAGMPADKDPSALARVSTLPRAIPARPTVVRSSVPPWLGAALFVVVMSAIVVLALRGAR
jgi:hypothetical protein